MSVTGTNLRRMVERARRAADHELRCLRMGVLEHRGIHGGQLRFRRAEGWSLGEGVEGWSRRKEAIVELGLPDPVFDLAAQSRLFGIRYDSANRIEAKAKLAVDWLERSFLAIDPLESVLFSFYALEAILGNRGEGTKALGLAFRRAMLSVVVEGSFADPDGQYALYVRVRSAAVHGGIPPEVTDRQALALAHDVRRALDEYLELADERGFTRPSQLRDALDEHPERRELTANLKEFWAGPWLELPD